MAKQQIQYSKGCPYSCSYCFNGKVDFEKVQKITQIKTNNIQIMDDAFLSNLNVVDIIKNLGNTYNDRKVIYYELVQGININDLTPEIANALYKARFVNIRFAWDGSYTSKNMYKVYDVIKSLVNAGYESKTLMCYILSNYYISYPECMRKLDLLKVWNVKVCNCVYRKNYLDPKIYPEQWDMKTIKQFRTYDCRKHNQLVIFNIDPQLKANLR